jgi:hypothetical protein
MKIMALGCIYMKEREGTESLRAYECLQIIKGSCLGGRQHIGWVLW